MGQKNIKSWLPITEGKSKICPAGPVLPHAEKVPLQLCFIIKMSYGVDVLHEQLHTPSFPIGLVKTEPASIVRSVETGLGRWMLVGAVISVDGYPFFAFCFLTCRFEDRGTGVFGYTLPPDRKETKLESSNQEASPSPGKNTGVVLVPCFRMEVHSYSYFRWCGYFWGPWCCHFLWQISSEWGSQKLFQGLVPHELTVYPSIFNQFKLN